MIKVISFTSFAVIFMKKMGVSVPPYVPRGRVSRQSQRVGVDATLFSFQKFWFAILKKISAHYDAETYRTCWKYHFPFVYAKHREILIFRTFIAKFWMFAYFSQKVVIFRPGTFLWRYDYVTPWLIVLILVCMNREGPYLPIDTKINFIGGSVQKI